MHTCFNCIVTAEKFKENRITWTSHIFCVVPSIELSRVRVQHVFDAQQNELCL